MKATILMLAVVGWAHVALAVEFMRPEASCGTVVTVMDSQDASAVMMVAQFLADALVEADKPFVQRRKGSLIGPMSVDELSGVIAYAVVKCRQEPRKLARQAASEAYLGMRAFSSAFGGSR